MGKHSSCEIILGSYEEFILGFQFNKREEEAEQTFAVHTHSGSIRSVAHCGDLLASGGSDDRIVVYNLKTRKEHCHLTHHNGTVNCLQFTNDHTHLISGGQDGMLAIIRVGNWQLEKIWEKAHKGASILDIALHPSGKLALSLGSDATLRTWNLVKGRQAYVINLNTKSKEPRYLHGIKWADDGVRFALVGNTYSDVWSIDSGGLFKSIEHKNKISSCIWYMSEKLIVGYDDGHFGIVNLESDEITVQQAHSSRVKCMALYNNKLITASSTGEIKVWNSKFRLLCTANAGCRFTCMCVIPNNVKDDFNDSVLEENNITLENKKDVQVKSEEQSALKRKKPKLECLAKEQVTIQDNTKAHDMAKQKLKKKLKRKIR